MRKKFEVISNWSYLIIGLFLILFGIPADAGNFVRIFEVFVGVVLIIASLFGFRVIR
jgi:hypothetical protein